jgi:hypothetical protein
MSITSAETPNGKEPYAFSSSALNSASLVQSQQAMTVFDHYMKNTSASLLRGNGGARGGKQESTSSSIGQLHI